MENLDRRITIATRHVDEGRRIVEQLCKLVAEDRVCPDAVELLKTFEKSLEIFEADLDRLLKERGRAPNV